MLREPEGRGPGVLLQDYGLTWDRAGEKSPAEKGMTGITLVTFKNHNDMYSKRQLDMMSKEISKAERRYHIAIADNLREIGEPVKVQDDDESINGISLDVECNGSLMDFIFDCVKWDEERNEVMVHSTDKSGVEDMWWYLTELGDAQDYLLEAIQWPEVKKENKERNVYPVVSIDREDLYLVLGMTKEEADNVSDDDMEQLAGLMRRWFEDEFTEALRQCEGEWEAYRE